MKKIISLLKPLTALLLAASLLVLAACGSTSGRIRFGTAGEGGNYNKFGTAFGEFLKDADLNVEVKVTAGSSANLRLIKEDYIQMGIVQADVMSEDIKATKGEPEYRAVAGLFTEVVHIVVRADSDITKIRDLRGRIVNVGEEESGTEKNAYQILQSFGITKDNITAKNLNYTDAAAALRNGDIDALFITNALTMPVIAELSEDTDIRFLSVTGTEAEDLISSYDFYEKSTIPAGTYTGQDSAVETVGVRAVLIVRDDIDDAKAEAIAKAYFENAADLKESTGLDLETDPKAASTGLPVDIQDGAEDYYESIGLEVD